MMSSISWLIWTFCWCWRISTCLNHQVIMYGRKIKLNNLHFSITPPFFLVEAGRLHFTYIGYINELYRQLKAMGLLSIFIKVLHLIIISKLSKTSNNLASFRCLINFDEPFLTECPNTVDFSGFPFVL